MVEFANARLKELWRCDSLEEISKWIIENGSYLATRAIFLENFPSDVIPNMKMFRIIDFKFENIQWKSQLRTSHKPIGYKKSSLEFSGLQGKINFSYYGDLSVFPSHIFNNTGICCGSGGGEKNKYISEVILFDKDWASMSVMSRLRGDKLYVK